LLKKIFFSLLVLYATLGFFVLPWVAKSQIVKTLAQETNSQLYIENISFNPFLFKLELENVQLTSLENKSLVNFKSLFVDVELYSLFRGVIHVKNVVLTEPEVFLTLSKEKKLNLLGIIKERPKEREDEIIEDSELPRIIIDNIKLS